MYVVYSQHTYKCWEENSHQFCTTITSANPFFYWFCSCCILPCLSRLCIKPIIVHYFFLLMLMANLVHRQIVYTLAMNWGVIWVLHYLADIIWFSNSHYWWGKLINICSFKGWTIIWSNYKVHLVILAKLQKR